MRFAFKELIFPVGDIALISKIDLENYNTEVIVLIEKENDEGDIIQVKYSAPFFTFNNIETMRMENSENGKFLSGKYFWVNGLTLVDNFRKDNIERVVKHLIEQGDFRSVFKSISTMN